VALDNETGNILAMVGGVDWEKSKVNVANLSETTRLIFQADSIRYRIRERLRYGNEIT
jgi:hypothetical protein